jgi:hypothetical protein
MKTKRGKGDIKMIRTCKDCGQKFSIGSDEERFFRRNNLELPVRCKPCREKRKQQSLAQRLENFVGKWVTAQKYFDLPIKIVKIEDNRIYYETILNTRCIEDNNIDIIYTLCMDWKLYEDELPDAYHVVIVHNFKRRSCTFYYKKGKIDISSLTSPSIRIEQYELNKEQLDSLLKTYKEYQIIIEREKYEFKCLDK